MNLFCRLLLTVLLAAGSVFAETPAPPKLRVLFIGNSLTSYNNLPAMLAAMSHATGHELTSDSTLVGGATLEKHWAQGAALAKIQAGGWDYVVLQGMSTETYTGRDSMFRHAHLFADAIRAVKARPLLYMTWALETAPEKFGAIEEAYLTLGKELSARVIPAGAAWQALTQARPPAAIALHRPDHKHPTPAGTYLTACLFYRVLYAAPAATIPPEIPDIKIPAATTKLLQQAADSTPLPTAPKE